MMMMNKIMKMHKIAKNLLCGKAVMCTCVCGISLGRDEKIGEVEMAKGGRAVPLKKTNSLKELQKI